MLGKLIVDAALSEELTLEYNGKPIATIHKAGFATPSFAAKCDYTDSGMREQILKIRQFDYWRSQAQHDPTDEELVAEMARIGVNQSYYDMRHGGGWATKDPDGVITEANILDMDEVGVEWRPGKVLFQPKRLLPSWLRTILYIIGFIAFLIIISKIHNSL